MPNFLELVVDVQSQLNQTSPESEIRIGKRINDRYKRVTSSLGIQAPRRTTVQATTVDGVQTLTFTGIEKIYNVQDRSSGQYRILKEYSVDEIRESSAVSAATANGYAILNTTSTTVTVLLDCVPNDEFVLYADGQANANTLSGTNEPAFAESFHDILYYGALADEYRKVMRKDLADDAEKMYERRLSELRMHGAASAYRDIYQGKRANGPTAMGASGTSGGSSSGSLNASSSWEQTGLITFNRSSVTPTSPPFAVTPAGAGQVDNLDAEFLQGDEPADIIADAVVEVGSELGLTSGRLAFPAVRNNSSNRYTLDGYDEFTWSPVVTFAVAGNLVVAYSIQVGTHTAWGDEVRATWVIATSTFTHTTASGIMSITGLPYAAANVTNNVHFGAMQYQGITKALYTSFVPRVNPTESTLTVACCGSGQTIALLTAADMPTGGSVILSGTITYQRAT